ncbi:hypothetical protein FRX31_025220 [Thalictrum thalictroides]|uniref:DUF7138 domain-containing protein n=1 Tax=Thalictrum thalictroides TaxID=46969 RepID=A0A7J6VJA4_THATH|nr:hypothetical protein FRX31_025220 [Thalictrum thalictroides]
MTESRLSIRLPVFVDDEENKETYVGNLVIDPRHELKDYHSQLSRMMGISPHKLTVSLFFRRKSRSKAIHRIQINEKANLGILLLGREKDCYILISSKMSRKGGKFHQEENVVKDEEYFTNQKRFSSSDPPPKLLLRRDSAAIPLQFSLNSSPYYSTQIPSSQAQNMYANQGLKLGLRNYESLLQMQKENCLMSYNSKSPYTEIAKNYEYRRDGIGGGGVCGSESTAICEVCLNAKGMRTEFHWCVLDSPISGYYQSKFGPIARPSKG